MKLSDLFQYIVKTNHVYQFEDGSFPAGWNGPYHDPETPVRNTGHWLIANVRAYELANDATYKVVAEKAARYLLSSEARPHKKTFHHRIESRIDSCNGLIGQAWSMEALVAAYKLLQDDRFINLAEDIFEMHEFDEHRGLWLRCDIDGRVLPIDWTFNHQLWFAACGSEVYGVTNNPEIKRKIDLFESKLLDNCIILENGLVFHSISEHWKEQMNFKNILKMALGTIKNAPFTVQTYKTVADYLSIERLKNKITYKSIGYHCFNTYAFRVLQSNFPNHPTWGILNKKGVFDYLATDEYNHSIKENKYGFPYNAPGFEVPFSLLSPSQTFIVDSAKEQMTQYVQHQLNKTFNSDSNRFDKNNSDPNTLTARIYELARLPNEVFSAIEVNI